MKSSRMQSSVITAAENPRTTICMDSFASFTTLPSEQKHSAKMELQLSNKG